MHFTQILCITFISICSVYLSPVKREINSNLKCGYQSCHAVDPEKITVHLVPHSHDDVGWLKTVDQYYNQDVRPVIETTVEALKKNPDRRFIQVETAFFWLWWKEHSNETRQDFINLLNNGQLEIVNGAWSMNDEAATNYQSIIDQYTWGFRILNDKLGICSRPKVGWQIDPFGHSREHASIITQLGFDGIFLGRLDFRDKEKRAKDQTLEFLWKTSNNLDNPYLFSSIFPEFYLSPKGFCWDIYCNDDLINELNVASRRDEFEEKMLNYAKQYRTNNILIPMGGDFHYSAAHKNFDEMDKLIEAFQDHESVQVIYSTPSCYIKAVNEEAKSNSITFPYKTDDFFPYASSAHSYWTGYFTSRPNSKRFERTGNNILQAAKQLFAFSKLKGRNLSLFLATLREAMGVMQHHDAISGTEKKHVAQSYVAHIHQGIKEIDGKIGSIIGNLLKKSENDNSTDLNLTTCLLANVSICEPANNSQFIVAVYNPLTRPITHYVRLPVESDFYKITGPNGKEDYEILDSISSFNYMSNLISTTKEIVFAAKKIPPLGLNLYYIENVSKNTETSNNPVINDSSLLYFGTETTGFEIDETTNKLKSVKMNGVKVEITQEFLYYESSHGDNFSFKSSGAYMFRPVTNTEAKPMSTNGTALTIKRGLLVDEVKQIINDKVTQIIRVYKGDNDDYIEFDWVVGPILLSTEIISRFTIKNFDNNNLFYTDSNGRQIMQRQTNYRSDYSYDYKEEPIASNYYPITSKIVLKDNSQNLQVAILNDRAQGGSSLKKGVIELMIHRRLNYDDVFGVSEALNEEEFGQGVVVRGQHYLIVGPSLPSEDKKSTDAQERDLAQRKLLAPWIMVADSSEQSLKDIQEKFNFQFHGLVNSLPENVHILTFEPWINHSYLLRLEHTLTDNEDHNLSQPATVDLNYLFSLCNITEIQEMTLGANQLLNDSFEEQGNFVWQSLMDDKKFTIQRKKIKTDNENPFRITLVPMQIRTFIITTDKVYDSDFNPDYTENYAHNN